MHEFIVFVLAEFLLELRDDQISLPHEPLERFVQFVLVKQLFYEHTGFSHVHDFGAFFV